MTRQLRGYFPSDPWMRRERMAIAALLCLCCLAGGIQVLIWAVGAYAPPFPQGYWLPVIFGCLAASFLFFATGFLLSFLIKLNSSSPAALRWKLRGQRGAYACLVTGLGLAVTWSVLLAIYQLLSQ